MSRVVHFEIQASQPAALIDFYTALLGLLQPDETTA